MSESTALVELSRGERHLAPLSQPAKFSDPIGRHHRSYYDDYEVAKDHIHQMIGSLDGLQLFGRQVLVGVFCKPLITDKGWFQSIKEIKEDWWQNKVTLLLKKGPEAFQGDESYLNAVFGDGVSPPKEGEWLIANASAGFQISMYDDGSRPQGKDYAGRLVDLFEWDGWPCRIVTDDCFLGRVIKPHSVV